MPLKTSPNATWSRVMSICVGIVLGATAVVLAPPASASNYSWTYDQRLGSGGTSIATFTVCQAYKLTSTSRTGFTFLGWYTARTGGTRVGGAGGSYTNCSSITLYAQWNYAVTFDGNDGTSEVGSISNAGVGVTLPSATRSGYTFSGWFSAATGGVRRGGAGDIYDPNVNITVFAQWVPATYEITYQANGGTVTPTSTNFTTGDPALTLPTPTRAQHTFNGWYTSPAGGDLIGTAGATYTPTVTTTLHAQWTPATYIVTYQANGGTVTPTSTNFTTGDPALTLPTPTRAQHTFNGWYTSPAGGDLIGTAGATYTPTVTTTLHAQWTQIPLPPPAPEAPTPPIEEVRNPEPPKTGSQDSVSIQSPVDVLLVPPVVNLGRRIVLTPHRMFTALGQEVTVKIRVQQRGKKGQLRKANPQNFTVIRRSDGFVAVRRLARQPLRVHVTWFAEETLAAPRISVSKIYWLR